MVRRIASFQIIQTKHVLKLQKHTKPNSVLFFKLFQKYVGHHCGHSVGMMGGRGNLNLPPVNFPFKTFWIMRLSLYIFSYKMFQTQ